MTKSYGNAFRNCWPFVRGIHRSPVGFLHNMKTLPWPGLNNCQLKMVTYNSIEIHKWFWERGRKTNKNKQTNKQKTVKYQPYCCGFHSCSPGPCLKSIKSTSSSGQMLTGCRIASKQWTIDETEKALFPLCSWSGANAVSAVGFYDDNNSPGAVGHYYKCAAGETLRVATCNLVTLLGGSEPGTCYHSYSKPGFVSP